MIFSFGQEHQILNNFNGFCQFKKLPIRQAFVVSAIFTVDTLQTMLKILSLVESKAN
jgi:hypothetical protein